MDEQLRRFCVVILIVFVGLQAEDALQTTLAPSI
jgi:hypothetical protein